MTVPVTTRIYLVRHGELLPDAFDVSGGEPPVAVRSHRRQVVRLDENTPGARWSHAS